MTKSEKIPRDALPGTLQHWREALPEERMAHLVKDTARGFSRSLQARLREHAVQYGHWTFLRILWQTDGLTQRQLSEQAGVAEPTTFSALKAMEALGYVTRQKMPDNRKQVRIFLTPKGTSLRALLVPAAVEVNRIALSGISPEDIAATRRTLLVMMENLAADPFFAARGIADALNGGSDPNAGDAAASDSP
ncbi:MarR family winged helix-turn-helix transcriptional regulator [Paraburkholderia sp. RL18-103-BIB-C]|jgi:DNA-binding MarR family transcriptional regulator|uniref:MarR family winged helix-turn-helix transcriptional regulator n=1 Tax=unclassified Paraburkholderia TaxID=2615204 RepID=UPI002F79C63F